MGHGKKAKRNHQVKLAKAEKKAAKLAHQVEMLKTSKKDDTPKEPGRIKKAVKSAWFNTQWYATKGALGIADGAIITGQFLKVLPHNTVALSRKAGAKTKDAALAVSAKCSTIKENYKKDKQVAEKIMENVEETSIVLKRTADRHDLQLTAESLREQADTLEAMAKAM